MRRSVVLAALSTLLAGCVKDNPRHCLSDDECLAKISDGTYEDSDDGDGFVLAINKKYCHPTKHYCYAGCSSDSDCRKPELRMNWDQPEKSRCSAQTHSCEADSDGGVGDGTSDLAMNLGLGAQCRIKEQCTSGACVDGYCCENDCPGTCRSCALSGKEGKCELVPSGKEDSRGSCGTDSSCAGTCDGAGGCVYPAESKDCGTPLCQDGNLTAKHCDGKGACQAGAPQGCGGFACTAAGDACKTTCGSVADCMTPFQCLSGACKGDLADGEKCFGQSAACSSNHCVDGVCCKDATCPECQSCGVPGKEGSCSPVPAGAAPASQCVGDALCGGGRCDGKGACDWKSAGTICTQTCTAGSPSTESSTACNSAHQCVAQPPVDCGFYNCAGANKGCLKGCASHADCVSGSVCDRSKAGETGLGECIDPAAVVTVPAGGNLQAAINNLPSGKTHLRIAAGTYTEALTIAGKKVALITDGVVIIDPPLTGAAVSISGSAAVTLQGLTLTGATGGASGIGVQCMGNGGTELALVESTVEHNSGLGIESSKCKLTVHRCTFSYNREGGMSLYGGGTATITDSLIFENGRIGSSIGGLGIASGVSLSFVNNTVAQNTASDGTAAGVICSSPHVLYNSILAGNGSVQYSVCAFDHSNVVTGKGAPPGSGNKDVDCNLSTTYKPAAGSACVNAGNSSAPGLSKLDRDSGPRIKGSAADMGAYEVQ